MPHCFRHDARSRSYLSCFNSFSARHSRSDWYPVDRSGKQRLNPNGVPGTGVEDL
jgi:hypothetical protein